MSKRIKWPDKLPILTADDICRDQQNGPNGTHCLSGWAYEAFRGYEGMFSEAREQFRNDLQKLTDGQEIAPFNDDRDNSKTQVAAVWNEAARKRKYVVECER